MHDLGDVTAMRADAMQARLYDQGIVLLNGDLDETRAGSVAIELMTLDALRDDPLRLLVNSARGTYDAAFTVIDVIDLLGVPVHATCIGRVEGPAVGVLAVAARRLVIPHGTLRLCEPVDAFDGRADAVASWAERRDHDREQFCARLSDAARRPIGWIEDAVRNGRSFDAHEAIRAGLVDEIATSNAATVRPFERPPVGFRTGGRAGRRGPR